MTRVSLAPHLCMAALLVLFIFAAFLRLYGLGGRSLWLDELCTWHVSRMPLTESVRWAPELTTPPVYQLIVRAITDDPRPPEWLLRLPAALSGILLVPVGYGLGRIMAGRGVGLALAVLLTFHPLLIHYSQEARAYALLVLGSAVSTLVWYSLVTAPRRLKAALYVVATTLTFYAHYMILPTVFAQVLWLIGRRFATEQPARWHLPLTALAVTAGLCAPMVIYFASAESTTLESFFWLQAPTFGTALEILGELSGGWWWVIAGLGPAVLIWLRAVIGPTRGEGILSRVSQGRVFEDPITLLMIWLICAWFGLLIMSWVARPVLLDRYALPASIAAMLIPLMVAGRLHVRAPLIIAPVCVVLSAGVWLPPVRETPDGFRELVGYLSRTIDDESEAIVLTMDNAANEQWKEMYGLALDYYPLDGLDVQFLPIRFEHLEDEVEILKDPRAIYLIVFPGDPFPILEAAGRKRVPIIFEDQAYEALPFEPYLLIKVAPLP